VDVDVDVDVDVEVEVEVEVAGLCYYINKALSPPFVFPLRKIKFYHTSKARGKVEYHYRSSGWAFNPTATNTSNTPQLPPSPPNKPGNILCCL
jgi:hypothetical protein